LGATLINSLLLLADAVWVTTAARHGAARKKLASAKMQPAAASGFFLDFMPVPL
jgi:hypothetical protein